MPLEKMLTVRIDEKQADLIAKVAEYRYKQVGGNGMDDAGISSYLRWLLNRDIETVVKEIQTRRSV